MEQVIRVLHAKLMAPRTAETIVRDRLEPLLAQIPQKRLTVVSAGAGYGKTTLISQAVQGYDTAWYRLDSLDRDFATFLSHLVAGINRHYPSFGKDTLERLGESQSLGMEYEAVLSVLLHELEQTIDHDLMIVLDDYHEVQDAPLVRDSVQFILERLCPGVHIVIIGRSDTPLQLSRLRSMREVLDIRTEDLLFTEQEIHQLFEQVFHISIGVDALQALKSRTSGWVSGLVLFFHTLRNRDPGEITDQIRRVKGSAKLISEYLEENVYNLLPVETRRFLTRTSILPRLNTRFCNEFLDIPNAGEILRSLYTSHLFTFVLDEDGQEYFYHHLFQDFLQTMLRKELPDDELLQLHRRAAGILEKSGEEEDAVWHYIASRDYAGACSLIERFGILLINSGRLELTNAYLERIPEPVIQDRPWILFLRATAKNLSGRYTEAMEELDQALGLFRTDGDRTGIDRCLGELAIRFYTAGEFARAEGIFGEMLRSGTLNAILRVEALGHLVFIASQLGRFEESDTFYSQAMALVNRIEQPDVREGIRGWLSVNHGFRHVISGDQVKALELANRARGILEKIHASRLMALAFHLTATAHFYHGNFSEGLDAALEGLGLVRDKGYRDSTLGWLLAFAGANACRTGKVQEGLGHAQEALEHFRELGTPFGQAYAYHVMQDSHRMAGRLDLAEDASRRAMHVMGKLDLPHLRGPIMASYADILLLKGNVNEAEAVIGQAEQVLTYSRLFDWLIAMLHARLHWMQGRENEAADWMLRGLTVSRDNGYERWVACEWERLLPLLAEISARGAMNDYILEICALAGPGLRCGLLAMQKTAAPGKASAIGSLLKSLQKTSQPGLKVSCLGRFQVSVGTREIPTETWKSKKAKMLFKLLLHYRRHGFVSKEVFMEHLWPEEDPEKTSKRFHVALTTLRRILEPDLERGLPSAYLKSDGDTYLLDLGKDGHVDLDAFEAACTRARQDADPSDVIGHLFDAERLYQGDFLDEDPFEPWCCSERDRLRDLYLAVLASIIEFYEMKKDYGKAITYCLRYLGVDAYAEDIHRDLIRFYSLAGNKTMAVKAYERCRELIVSDLGCTLDQETESLYKELLKD